MTNTVQGAAALLEFLSAVLPATIPPQRDMKSRLRITDIATREDFIGRVMEGIKKAPMAIRLSPHILSVVDWSDPLNDPIRRQFIPVSSPLNIDHPMAVLDPMHEDKYSPVDGLIHRYPDRALFLGSFPFPPSGGAVILTPGRSNIHLPRLLPLLFSVVHCGHGDRVREKEEIHPAPEEMGAAVRLHRKDNLAPGHRDLGRRHVPPRAGASAVHW